MQDRFELELRAALHRARLIAQRQGVHQIGTAHLALSLLMTDGPGQPGTVAVQALAGMGADVAALARALQEGLARGEVRFFPPQMAFDTGGGRALQLALVGAQQMGHAGVGTDHVLAALMQEPDGPLPKALAPLGIDAKRVIEGLQPVFQARPRETPASTTQVQAPAAGGRLTESAQRIVDSAAAIAQRYGHGPAGTPHLALALLDDVDRLLGSLLRRAGVNPADVRQLLLQQMRVEA